MFPEAVAGASPIRWLLPGACATLLTACGGTVHSARMWFPTSFGMDEVNPRLYVEPIMTAEQRQDVQHQINVGRAQVESFFGSITTAPYFVVCVSRDCDVRFGSYGQPAAAYGDMAIRVRAEGMLAPLVAHEWSHAEVYHRVGGWWYARRIPRWFDEGVAVVVANETRHSDDNWREVRRQGLPIPTLDELISFSDWGAAVNRYGETAGDVPSNLHVVYTTVGHEVRGFLSCAGTSGIASVLSAVSAGLSFKNAYAEAGGKCVR